MYLDVILVKPASLNLMFALEAPPLYRDGLTNYISLPSWKGYPKRQGDSRRAKV